MCAGSDTNIIQTSRNTKKGTNDKRGYSVELNTSTTVQNGFIAFN